MSASGSSNNGRRSEVEAAKPELRASSSPVLRSEVREVSSLTPAGGTYASSKEYHLKPATNYQPVSKLDSSDYSGKVVYRRGVRTNTGAVPERGGAAPGAAPGLSNGHIQSLLLKVRQPAQIEIWRGGSLVHCQRENEAFAIAPTKRGTVKGFSRKSRSRMIATQAKIRWNLDRLPYFMGNTCPDTVPDADHVIAAWAKFTRRFERRFPKGALLWRKEIKDRKSGTCLGQWVPHFHSFAYNCPRKFEYQEERGEWVTVRKRKDGGWTIRIFCLDDKGNKILHQREDLAPGVTDRLTEWWSRNWYEAMGSGEIKHYNAGASYEQIKTLEGVRFYTAKYMAKVEEAGQSPHCKGRWWGIVARTNIPWAERVVIQLTDIEAVNIMRVLRRYVLGRAKRKFRCNHGSMNYLVNNPVPWERFVAWVLAERNVPF